MTITKILNPIRGRTVVRCKICPWTLVILNYSFGLIILFYFSSLASEEHEVTVYNAPQTFYVVDCGASGHNIRARPSLKALPVGKLKLGCSFLVTEQVGNGLTLIWWWIHLISMFSDRDEQRKVFGRSCYRHPHFSIVSRLMSRLGLWQSIAIKWFTCATKMTYCRVSA